MKRLIIANWKMNPSNPAEAKAFFNSITEKVKNIKNVKIIVCPPFAYLLNFKSKILNLKLGAQNCFWEQKGAFTGEVSPIMLKNLGCQYVILGHSERRALGETDEIINKKIKAALETGLLPIFCVGDKSKKFKKKFKEIQIQLEKGLSGIKKPHLKKIIIAYEPVWAISATPGARAASVEETTRGKIYIKEVLNKLFGDFFSSKIKILYGGSVNSQNCRDYIKEAKFQGLLVGGASLKTQEFIKIIKNVETIK